jgi:hypothetical protein
MTRSRPLATLALSAMLALPGAPVRADGPDAQDYAQILAGLLAVYGVSEALEDREQRAERRTEVDHRYDDRPGHGRDRFDDHGPGLAGRDRHIPGSVLYGNGRDRDEGHPRGYDGRWARVVPDRCAVAFQGRDGPRLGYEAGCTRAFVIEPDALPRDCLRRVETGRGESVVYPRRCLAREGWNVGRLR